MLANTPASANMQTENQAHVALLSQFARGDVPGGFSPELVKPLTRYANFDVVPMATWGNGGSIKAHLMQVRAHDSKAVSINAALFKNDSIKALALDRQIITDTQPAMLYVLEEVGSAK
jgi:hypothetical protein